MALTLAGAIYPVVRAMRKRKRRRKTRSVHARGRFALPLKQSTFRLNWAAAFSLFIVVVFACALWKSRTFPFTTGFFPWVIGFPVLALAIFQLIMDMKGKEASRRAGHVV